MVNLSALPQSENPQGLTPTTIYIIEIYHKDHYLCLFNKTPIITAKGVSSGNELRALSKIELALKLQQHPYKLRHIILSSRSHYSAHGYKCIKCEGTKQGLGFTDPIYNVSYCPVHAAGIYPDGLTESCLEFARNIAEKRPGLFSRKSPARKPTVNLDAKS